MLPQLAQGDSNKVFVIPSEFSEAFGGLGRALGGGAPKVDGNAVPPTVPPGIPPR
jgi:hypothetical protein